MACYHDSDNEIISDIVKLHLWIEYQRTALFCWILWKDLEEKTSFTHSFKIGVSLSHLIQIVQDSKWISLLPSWVIKRKLTALNLRSSFESGQRNNLIS